MWGGVAERSSREERRAKRGQKRKGRPLYGLRCHSHHTLDVVGGMLQVFFWHSSTALSPARVRPVLLSLLYAAGPPQLLCDGHRRLDEIRASAVPTCLLMDSPAGLQIYVQACDVKYHILCRTRCDIIPVHSLSCRVRYFCERLIQRNSTAPSVHSFFFCPPQ